jgi:hypothetical protein
MHVVPRVRQARRQCADDDSEDEELRHGRIRKAGRDHSGCIWALMARRRARGSAVSGARCAGEVRGRGGVAHGVGGLGGATTGGSDPQQARAEGHHRLTRWGPTNNALRLSGAS